jgi:hypothetical protein
MCLAPTRLAQDILKVLNDAFPDKRGLRDLREALPEYGELTDEEWFLLFKVAAQNRGSCYRYGERS